VLVAVFFSGQPSKLSSAALSSASVFAAAANSIARPIVSDSTTGAGCGMARGVKVEAGVAGLAADGAAEAGAARAINRFTGSSPTASSAPASTSQARVESGSRSAITDYRMT